MKVTYRPKGVCSQLMEVDVENGVVVSAKITGGCSGNTQGVCSLVTGMDAATAVEKMRGIKCGFKPTSCPDQLSIAIEQAMKG